MRAALAVVASGFVALASSAAHAEPRTLRYDLAGDASVTGVGAAAWLATELAKPWIARASCAWCDRTADGAEALNALDASGRRGLAWSSPRTADTLSNVTGFALAPACAFGLTTLAAWKDGGLRGAAVDALLIAEATAIAADVNQLVKFSVARERPFVHALPASEKGKSAQPSDENLSFYSGHTSLVFALAVSSGTVASLRGYRFAPLVWGAGLATAATTGYLRIAADKHYVTDVLVGALAGSAIGAGVPLLFHRPGAASSVTAGAAPAAGGLALRFGGAW